MNSDFDTALKSAEAMTVICDHYLQFPENMQTRIRYVDIIQSPAVTLRYLCQRLGITLTDRQTDEIVTKYSKANVAKRIAEKEQAYQEHLQKGIEADDIERVSGFNDSVRVYDKTTGFQSGHVSDYQDGD